MLSDSSDSSRDVNLLLVHQRKMIWSPSSDPEASTSDQKIVLHRDSDTKSASHEQEDPSRFIALEDAVADMARDLDLPPSCQVSPR